MENNAKRDVRNVCILLSSYNGSKYILEQLESISNQQSVNVVCYIRDDGSTDDTVDKIQGFISNHENFVLNVGENIGLNRSFAELINNVPDDFDFYAFSDQDDIWLPDKLICAISKLANIDSKQPALYCSNLIALFETGLRKKVWFGNEEYANKSIMLIQNWAWGCTEVFNNAARSMCLKYPWKTTSMHDYWMHLLCAYYGTVVYDKESRILYRQHDANNVGVRRNSLAHLVDYLKKFFKENGHSRQEDAQYLLAIGGFDDTKLIKDIKKIAYYNNSLKNKLSLFFDFRIHMLSVISDIAYRIRIIRGYL